MRLHEREAYRRHQQGVVTMEDVARDRKAQARAQAKHEEQQQRAAKQAAKGPALPGLEDR